MSDLNQGGMLRLGQGTGEISVGVLLPDRSGRFCEREAIIRLRGVHPTEQRLESGNPYGHEVHYLSGGWECARWASMALQSDEKGCWLARLLHCLRRELVSGHHERGLRA